MFKQIEIALTVLCLVLGVLFLTLIIVRIRKIYLKKIPRVPIGHKKVGKLNRFGKLTMAISLLLMASGFIYFVLFTSPQLKFISDYVKIPFSVIFGLWALFESFLCFSVSEKLLSASIFKRIIYFIAIIICLIGAIYMFPPLASALLNPDSNQSQPGLNLPDTPSGNCATDYFDAFNSGNNDQMRKFILKYRSESYIKNRSIKEQIESYNFMYMVGGVLTPVSFVHISDFEIIVFASTNKQGRMVKARFEVDNKEPYHLLIYTIDPCTQEEAQQQAAIDVKLIESTIDSLAVIIKDNYVDPEKGKIMADSLYSYKSTGRYNEITNGSVLSLRLTEDLWSLCHDKHLGITYGKIVEEADTLLPEANDSADNYGFRSGKILENNIGYIRFDEFNGSEEAKKLISQAFETVIDCNALIFDLRYNSGGSPVLVHYVYSYLFDKPTYVGSRYDRIHNDTTDFWTYTDIPGKTFDDQKPIYILTSSHTFSAAEEFAYFLKDMKRAVIVGKATGGGAHQVMHLSVNDFFGVRIPFARMISPVSKTEWEGVGVIPDIDVPMDEALEAACNDAVKKIENME